MYLPAHFEETDLGVLHTLVESHPLATWVLNGSGDDDAPLVNHVPFLLDRTRGPFGTLIGHVARANPVWQHGGRSVLVFQGPQAYISPGFYPSKQEHGKVVPTWNYAVVHAHGRFRAIEQPDELLALVSRLTDHHERDRPAPWQVGDAPAAYVDQMLRAIVGIELPIERLVGKWKVSQNRPAADRSGVATGLVERARRDDATMARLVSDTGA